METLASFKRDLSGYKSMTMVNCSFPNRLLKVERPINNVNTVGFSLVTKQKNGKTANSYMDYPKASGYKYNKDIEQVLLSFEDDYFVYQLNK